ncbi:MAG: glycosyltransferase [Planctomycetota bacterium]
MKKEETEDREVLFSILMPAYNEYAFVRRSIERVLAAPLPEGVLRELVVVDDGSTDGTGEILQELERSHPEIRLIVHEKNRGKGASIRTAIAAMRGEIAIFQDADLEYDPREYAKLIAPILAGYADVVYGSRFANASERRVLYYHHMLGNLFLTHLSNLFTNLNLTDMETCYKAFRASILRSLPIRSEGFGIEPEITAKVAKRDCVVYEMPISYRGRSYEEGKKITWVDGVRAFGVILKYWLIDDCYEERYGHHVLMAMSSASAYTRWVGELVRPHLGRHVLELGSGIGNMSLRLRGKPRLTLSDMDPVYLDLLRNLFAGQEGVDVVELDVTEPRHFAALRGEAIDTVVAFNLLEHIEDDAAVLREVHALLPTGGRLILQLPQYPALFSSFDEALEHKRRYDKLGLRGLLFRSGFEVDYLTDLNWLGVPGWFLNGKLLRRKTFGRIQLKVFNMLVPLLRLTHRLPLPGLSILAVARKR